MTDGCCCKDPVMRLSAVRAGEGACALCGGLVTENHVVLRDVHKRALHTAVERACAEEGVDPGKLEAFVKVSNMDSFQSLVQSRWVRALYQLWKDSET